MAGGDTATTDGPIATVYSFVTDVPKSRWPAHISVAPADIVFECFHKEELLDQFGGWAKYRNQKTGADWIGIWGAKKASRFRRLLRERGAMFAIQKCVPRQLHMIVASTRR